MIELKNLVKRYDATTVVDDVSMIVEARTITAIVGTSGSGKTTLMRMINRLVEPTSGSVFIDGHDTREIPAFELRRSIGYAIQNHGLFPHRTVGQNIATVPVLLGWEKPRISARVDTLLDLFGLEPAAFRDRYPHELSGGQQQRVGVARALAAEPNILLMDEPFGALDPIIRAKAQEDLLTLQKTLGVTIVIVTHDMEEAIHLGHQIAVMDAGRLLQCAPPHEILAHPATPFVEELIGTDDRPFRLLSLAPVKDAAEPGEAVGPPISADSSQRDALSQLLWSGAPALPVIGADGLPIGRVTVDALVRRAARPE
jgi:osmoprotectant transport system ATP-binding protein